MKRLHIFIFALFLAVQGTSVFGQEVSGFEYFWDLDPGIGLATFVATETANDTLEQTADIPTEGLSSGRHMLYVRARSSEGVYGPTRKREVFISSVLANAEYFWDNDPGVGNATPISINTEGQLLDGCGQISTAGLSIGLHTLYIRSLSADGRWGNTRSAQLEITAGDVPWGCPGDFSMDGQITTSDLLALLGEFGTGGPCSVDLTDDDQVNISDMLIFLSVFGTNCPTQ